MNRTSNSWMRQALVLATIAAFTAAAQAEDKKTATEVKKATTQRTVQVVVTGEDDSSPQQYELTVGGDGPQPSKYWIGILCTPLEDELLKSHLKVEQGMVINQVIKDSPADKAGLAENDLLLMIGEKPLADVKVLVQAIKQAEGKEVVLTILHEGERKKVTVAPAERPDDYRHRGRAADKEAVAEWRMLQDALLQRGAIAKNSDNAEEDETSERELSMMLVMPGVVVPDQAKDLPSNLEVTITKKGNKEATIIVKRGNEKWEVDSESLDELPEDLRPHIKRMLGNGANISFQWNGNKPGWLDASSLKASPKARLLAPKLLLRSLDLPAGQVYQLHEFENKLQAKIRDKVRRQLEQTQKAVENVRTQIPAETLERIEKELQSLREQLNELRSEKADEDD